MFLQVSSPFLLIRPSPLSIFAVFLRPPFPLFFSPPPHPSSFSLFPLPSQGIIEKMANTLQGEIAVLEHSEWIAKVLYKMTGLTVCFKAIHSLCARRGAHSTRFAVHLSTDSVVRPSLLLN